MRGGSAAALAALGALGLVPSVPAYAGPPAVAPDTGNGRSVVIVGAGIAGLVAAFELHRAGFACTMIEATERPGGRVLTIRSGDRVVEAGSSQQADWPQADHLYFEGGASRISHQHHATLDYCRRLGVRIAPFINENRSAFAHDEAIFGGAPVRMSRIAADIRGYVAELVAKTLLPSDLELPLTEEDYERVMDMLRLFGGLARSGNYRGSPRAGFEEMPGVGTATGRVEKQLPLEALLRSRVWQEAAIFPELFDHASPMFEPVGGMDRLTQAFLPHVPSIKFNSVCTKVERTGEHRVRIFYRGAGSGPTQSIEADHAVITTPLTALRSVENDFRPEWRSAISSTGYVPVVRVGFHTKSRFWERQGIYGGISWTSQDIAQIWYPSSGLLGKDGLLTGAYIWAAEPGLRFSQMSPAARHAATLDQAARLHPELPREAASAVSVAWRNRPFSGGGWAERPLDRGEDPLPRLPAEDGPYLLAGEHLSNLPGWQEGSVLSAHAAVRAIFEQVAKEKS
jgi:monoamine oxidase